MTETTAMVVRRLGRVAFVCGVLLVALNLYAVQAEVGQRHDDVAFEGHNTVPEGVSERSNDIMGSITGPAVALLSAVMLALAVSQHRWRAGLAGVALVAVSVVSAETLKALINRPQLQEYEWFTENSWPSGHVTASASVGFAFVMVAPSLRRSLFAGVAWVSATLVGLAAVRSGWHRPSDAIGALLLVLFWGSVVSAVMVLWRGTGSADSDTTPTSKRATTLLLEWGGALLTIGVVAYVATVLVDRSRDIGAAEEQAALSVATLLIAGIAAAVTAVFLWELRDVVLDPRPNRETGQPESD